MYKIQTLNNISVAGLERLPRGQYEVASDITSPDAILLRSQNMHDMDLDKSVLAVGRAGAGVNNIPVDKMTRQGIPVFNAPGANANAVKELVIAGMLLACRNIGQAWQFARNLSGDDESLHKQVEAGKKQFVGFELPRRTLGVIGLGAIGVKVANAALAMGMEVYGYDPEITVERAWQMSSSVKQANTVDHLLSVSDFITFHVPLIDATRDLINEERIQTMKDNAVILNFARDGIVNNDAVCKALDSGKLFAYICDFPTNQLNAHERVVALPHLGASTREAEENCAIMVADQVRDYLELGVIKNSVNFPTVKMAPNGGHRIAVVNLNVPNMLGQMSTALANGGLNIIDMVNKSRGEIAYTLVDVESECPQQVIAELKGIKGVLSVRLIGKI